MSSDTLAGHTPGQGPLCAGLPDDIVDRYWGAHYRDQRFAHMTAVQACHACPVRVACLAHAIRLPKPQGRKGSHRIWGGVSSHVLAALHHRYLRERTSAWRLAEEHVRVTLAPFRGAYGNDELRRGHMPTHTPTRETS